MPRAMTKTVPATPAEFKAWRARMAARRGAYSQSDAAADLGLTSRMVKMYERGINPSRRDLDGEPLAVAVPRAVGLACAALEAGLQD
jgi:hypothetical protein